jgi:hypothetical protein
LTPSDSWQPNRVRFWLPPEAFSGVEIGHRPGQPGLHRQLQRLGQRRHPRQPQWHAVLLHAGRCRQSRGLVRHLPRRGALVQLRHRLQPGHAHRLSVRHLLPTRGAGRHRPERPVADQGRCLPGGRRLRPGPHQGHQPGHAFPARYHQQPDPFRHREPEQRLGSGPGGPLRWLRQPELLPWRAGPA